MFVVRPRALYLIIAGFSGVYISRIALHHLKCVVAAYYAHAPNHSSILVPATYIQDLINCLQQRHTVHMLVMIRRDKKLISGQMIALGSLWWKILLSNTHIRNSYIHLDNSPDKGALLFILL